MTYEIKDLDGDIITCYRFSDVIMKTNINSTIDTTKINWLELSNKLIYISYHNGNISFRLNEIPIVFNDKNKSIKFMYYHKCQFDEKYQFRQYKMLVNISFVYEEDYFAFVNLYNKYLNINN